MNVRAYSFLEGVLGKDGARAFRKAMDHERTISNAVIPRAILSWIDLATRYQYEGSVPGVDNTYIQFKKSEGTAFDGALSVGEDVYTFKGASRYHVAATVAVMLGVNALDVDNTLRDITMERLGKSIDTLVKARVAVQELEKKVLDPNAGYRFSHEHHDLGDGNTLTKVNVHSPAGEHVGAATFTHKGPHLVPGSVVVDDDHQRRGIASAMYSHAQKQTGKAVLPSPNQTHEGAALWQGNAQQKQFGAQALKTELPGQSNKPREHAAPLAPQQPQFQQAQPRPPPKTALKITKSQADHKCSLCRRPQFKAGTFVGCFCFMDMAKSVRTVPGEGFYTLHFKGNEWDQDAIDALRAALRGK